MANSNTLFLIICSNTKRRSGKSTYNAEARLAAELSGHLKHDLLETRKKILGLLRQSGKRDDVLLSDLPRNKTLVGGPDFDGSDKTARYFPAAQRYNGSFYRAIGADAAQLLAGTQHHILILSGLYGLLRADEPIQDYSCHIDDHPHIRPLWRDTRLLTTILLAYLKAHNISQVFDFTALAGYRELISWNAVTERAPNVWHAFGQQSVGDGLLTPLGELLGQWLRATDDTVLTGVASGALTEVATETEGIYFYRHDQPAEGSPREVPLQHQMAAKKDEIVRLARCLKYLLASTNTNTSDLNEPDRIVETLKRQRKVDAETAKAMHYIFKRRNGVEHDANYPVSSNTLANQRADFRLVEAWAKQDDRLKSNLQECQGG